MRVRWLVPLLLLFVSLVCGGCDSLNLATGPSPVVDNTKEALKDISSNPAPLNGVEFTTLHGWLANTYSHWSYISSQATVHPVPRLWTANRAQSLSEFLEQDRQLVEYGAAALGIEFNPNPVLGDADYWRGLGALRSSLPFFVVYEHINQGNGSSYVPADGPKDMNLEVNRQTFRKDIDVIFQDIIIPYQSKYVTVNGKAIVYMWSSVQMTGDLAGLLNEARKKYPVFFIGSSEGDPERIKMLDGMMEYSLGGSGNYMRAIENYNRRSVDLRSTMRRIESETGKRMLLIPTFQAAYDDSRFPGRSTPIMYPKSKEELKYHAELIRSGMGGIYDPIGPFVVYSELFEGAAVIESQCLPETMDRPGRFVGCGTGRLNVLKEYFGR